ncbi:hypothetical protein GPAL_3082 [Glaciecola pallidula DSM 14239 = ACAM 615]|uniref:Uncharacterized protein n=1 Tax=Brumicola pallidula DSM 14239 = ACAM 615 TaxID=1121922 RepID=K6ZM29_9ALTE|nr:hypothetical protein GPAL_3082 [Glaciecola pallidula DSM 14239 = ACAM 615]
MTIILQTLGPISKSPLLKFCCFATFYKSKMHQYEHLELGCKTG